MRFAAESCGRKSRVAVVVATLAVAIGACGDDSDETSDAQPAPTPPTTTAEKPNHLKPAPCPPDLAGCRTVSGRIIYVEKIDPDGDGDAHFVLASDESPSGPGISVVDVAASLRPDPLPGVGDELSAAGTVARGSYGQRQIEAVEIRFAPRG